MAQSKKNRKRKKKTQTTKKNIKKKIVAKNKKRRNAVKKKNTTLKKKINNVKQKENLVIKEKNSFKKEEKKEKRFFRLDESILDKEIEKKLEVEKILELNNPINKPKTIFIKRLPSKIVRNLSLISILCLILAILIMFPFGVTNYKSEASGKILDIPKFSILSEECCMYNATFQSIRSASSLKIELDNIISKYKQVSCDGKDYYYNEEEDFTIIDYNVKRGFIFNEYFITYDKGNSCEVDSVLKNIELLPDNYSLEDAKREGNYVIDGEEEFNVSSYNQFLDDVDNEKASTLRIVKADESGDVIITDLKYLEEGKFKVIYDGTRDKEKTEENYVMMAYVYEHIGIYKNKFYAYNGKSITNSMLDTDDVYYLFDMVEEDS